MKPVDLSLGINPQAWAVAHLLEGMDLAVPKDSLVMTNSSAWYNGRERGICFTVWIPLQGSERLHVAVYEHRNSDQVCALRWTDDRPMINPPTINDSGKLAYPTEDKYDVSFEAGWGEAGKVAVWVLNEMQKYTDSFFRRGMEYLK